MTQSTGPSFKAELFDALIGSKFLLPKISKMRLLMRIFVTFISIPFTIIQLCLGMLLIELFG